MLPKRALRPDGLCVELYFLHATASWRGEVVLIRSTSRAIIAQRAKLRAMDKAIAQLNIAHYRKQLAVETDQAKRVTLQRLLAEEEAKLAALNHQPSEQKPKA